jgi:hypothetical protein
MRMKKSWKICRNRGRRSLLRVGQKQAAHHRRKKRWKKVMVRRARKR